MGCDRPFYKPSSSRPVTWELLVNEQNWIHIYLTLKQWLHSVRPHYSASVTHQSPQLLQVTMLLASLLSTLLTALLSRISCPSRHATVAACSWMTCHCMARLQCAVANSTWARSKMRANFKRWFRCENFRQTDNVANAVAELSPVCHQPSPSLIQNFLYKYCDIVFQWLNSCMQ